MIRFALALMALLAVALFTPGQALADTQDTPVAAPEVCTPATCAAPGGAVCEKGVCAKGLVRGQPLRNTVKVATAPARCTVRFLHNRKPVRRVFGRLLDCRRGRCCH
jgi:hypothetical protein